MKCVLSFYISYSTSRSRFYKTKVKPLVIKAESAIQQNHFACWLQARLSLKKFNVQVE